MFVDQDSLEGAFFYVQMLEGDIVRKARTWYAHLGNRLCQG
jgi:hypothetical protein